ncbi:MAG: dihydrolipoamide acetyltransferase family protein [Terriglobales bacterium]
MNFPTNMAFSVVMPALEMGQETGKLVAWRKKEGETVVKGEPLLEVETDKAVLEVEAPADGILTGVNAQEGAVIPVGQTVAWIVRPGEQIPKEATPSDSAEATSSAAPGSSTQPNTPLPATTGGRISPKARRLAKEHGIDINTVRGSGADGEVIASDIQAVVYSKTVTPPETHPEQVTETLSATGRLMAERTTQSWTTVPHFFLVREIETTQLIKAREKLGPALKDARGVKLTHTDLLVALVAHALTKHPRMNASWNGNGIHFNPQINIGIAMAVQDGVVAAVIQKANVVDLGEIAGQRTELTERARAKKLRPSDIANGTFTISNLGMYQIDAFNDIITPPQAAILAVGRIADRVVAIEGRPEVRPMMTLTLSCDHRVVDGAHAALFLQELAEVIREPEKWLR